MDQKLVERIKFLAASVLAVVLLLIVSAGGRADKAIANDDFHLRSTPEKTIADKKAVERYHLQKRKLTTALQDYFNNAIASGDIVGAGVSIVHGDSIVISDGFGKRSIDQKAKVDKETVFRLGSLSKGFAGVLAASLQAEGKLDWNDKIVDYIPEFQFGDSLNTQKVKLSHILSHTSGTPYHSYTNLVEAGLPVATIAARFNEVAPISAPGMMYSYQNAMFSLSQEVIKNVTGEDVKTVLQNQFFKPLGMSTTSMDHKTLLSVENRAMPHTKQKNGWDTLPLKNRYYNAVVAGGINASSLDMAKWMRFLLGHNPEVASKETIEKAFSPFVKVSYNNKYYQRWPGYVKSSYGFGWRIHTLQENDSTPSKTLWHHGGSVNNYRNEIALYPQDDLGICVLLNGNSKLAQTIIPDLYELVKKVYN